MSEAKLPIGKRILLALAFLADCLDEARLLGGLVGVTYEQTYGWAPPQYKRQNFYSRVKKFVDKGYIRKVGRGKNLVLRLTPEGKIKAISPLGTFWPEEWDGIWTLVFFDIQESSRRIRKLLRRLLKRLKFGMFQRSVWVFPGDFVAKLRQLIKEINLEDFVLVISSDDLGIDDQKALAEKIWCVSSLNRKYKKLVGEVRVARSFSIDKQAVRVEEFKERLLGLLSMDPMLPLKLLPDNWAGKTAAEVVLEFKKELIGRSG